MVTKEKLKKEIDKLPSEKYNEAYRLLSLLKDKKK